MFVKIKKGYVIKKIGQDTVALYTGDDTVDLCRVIVLNPVARLLFEEMLIGCDEEHLAEKLLSVYDITHEKAKQDAAGFVKNLSEKGLLD